MSDVEKTYMTWQKFDEDIAEFITYLDNHGFNGENTVILGLKRGGFPTATALSNKTNIPVSTVAFQTRDGEDVKPNFLEPEMIANATRVIIPDDIYDSGLTVETVIDHLENRFAIPRSHIAGCFHYGSDKMPTTKLQYYRVIEPSNGAWICFPWE